MTHAVLRRTLAALLPLLAPLWLTPPAGAQGLSDYASRVVELTNAERARAGLSPLASDGTLALAAYNHSADMAQRRFFDHYSPEGRNPGDRIRSVGYPAQAWGENIAYGYRSPEAAVAAWMNSPGHRANIMEPGFREIGVGVAQAGTGEIYWTQVFATRAGGGFAPPPLPPPPASPPSPATSNTPPPSPPAAGDTGRPQILSIDPTVALPGGKVRITGRNLTWFRGTVTLNGVPLSILSWGPEQIEVWVPVTATSGNLVVAALTGTSDPVSLTVSYQGGPPATNPPPPPATNPPPSNTPPPPPPPSTGSGLPQIVSLDVSVARPGQLVRVNGRNFSWFKGTVTVSGVNAGILWWGEDHIDFYVPMNTTSGNVVVTNDAGASNGVFLTISNR